MLTRGRADCPVCEGKGYIIRGQFPCSTATPCVCIRGLDLVGVQKRYENTSMASFRAWWLAGHSKELTGARADYAEALEILATSIQPNQGPLENDLPNLMRFGPYFPAGHNYNHPYDPPPKALEDAVMPRGLARVLRTWSEPDPGEAGTVWIFGRPRSGKTSLAVALLRARCEAVGGTGAYASCVALGDALQSYYNRTVGAGTYSDRIGMTPDPKEIYGGLFAPDCLVLDGLDCLPSDRRVVSHFLAVLNGRDADNKITIVTASETSGSLQSGGRHPFILCDQSGVVGMSRLAEASPIETVAALAADVRATR